MFLLFSGAGLNSVSFSFSFSGVILFGRFLDVVEVLGDVVDASSLSLFAFPCVAAFLDEVVTVSASSAALLVRNSCSPRYRKLLSCDVAL